MALFKYGFVIQKTNQTSAATFSKIKVLNYGFEDFFEIFTFRKFPLYGMCVCVCACVSVCRHVCMLVCMCVYVCAWMCVKSCDIIIS